MVRSLWTAATGMIAQQTNVDTIANNLANVNTVGYKTEVNEFRSLLYQNIQTKTTKEDGTLKPVGAQVGLGVRNSAITSIFKQGSLLDSESDSAFAVEGKGFFSIKSDDGNTYYTRNGNFQWTLGVGGTNMLASMEGYPVLDSNGKAIELAQNYVTSRVSITNDGEICYPDEENNPQPLGIRVGLYQFSNPAGLEKKADGLFEQTAASGPAMNEATNNSLQKSNLVQGYLEGSNVQVVDEMVNMIVAQRAYELNSKAITASDEMMQQANNLRR